MFPYLCVCVIYGNISKNRKIVSHSTSFSLRVMAGPFDFAVKITPGDARDANFPTPKPSVVILLLNRNREPN